LIDVPFTPSSAYVYILLVASVQLQVFFYFLEKELL